MGCQLALEMISLAQNCAVSAVHWKQAPHPKYCFRGQFFGGACKTSKLIPKFFMGVCSGKSIHILFQMWSKLVQDKYPKGRVGDGKNKTHLAEPLGQFPKFFIGVHTVVPHLYSRFNLTLFRFGGVIIKKPFRNPQSDFNMASSSLYLIQCVFYLMKLQCFVFTSATCCDWLAFIHLILTVNIAVACDVR